MILLFCMLIAIGSCYCNDLPSRTEVESSINRTIDEVERLIRQNSTLPELNRQQIIDILVNITSKDVETNQNKKTIEQARNMYQKALMVVLPYNAEDAKDNIKDLYTKPPRVKLIQNPFSSQEIEAWKNKKTEANILEENYDKQSFENFVVTYAPEKSFSKKNLSMETEYKNHKDTYSEERLNMSVKETIKTDNEPIKFSFNLEDIQKQPIFTEKSAITTKRPIFEKSKNEEVYVVYSTSATTTFPETTKKNDVSTFNLGSESTSRPLKSNTNVLSVDQWRYNAPTTQSTTTLPKLPNALFKKIRDKQSITVTVENVTMTTPINKINHVSEISKIITFDKTPIISTEKSVPIFVTPSSFSSSSSSPSSSEKLVYNSTYNLNSGGFRKITTTTIRPKVMELLASIGLRPKNAINVEDIFKKNKEIEDLEKKSQIPNTDGLIYTTFGISNVKSDSPSITAQNTFENPISEIGKGMNNLTPDVRMLFQRFGLQSSNIATTTPKPTVNTNSYTNFKPLPTSRVKNEDMKEFLAKFGLGVSDNRQKKSMPVSTERPSLIEAVPSHMRQILENLGLISRKIPTTPKMKEIEPTKETVGHIFKPHEVHVKDERQRTKIIELLNKIRLVQEGKASATDVRKVADDLLATTKTLKDGPDPLSLEEIIKIYNEDVKNEIKRQNSEETTTNDDRDLANTTVAPTESVDVSSTTTTIASVTFDSTKNDSNFLNVLMPAPESSTSAKANLMALEESFGGTTSAPDPVLPTKRRNGLYFLVDWNTFLEVGEDQEKVNLRFEPKVGDRSRFLPVTVP